MNASEAQTHYHLRSYLEQLAPLSLSLPDPPARLIQGALDIKNICSGHLATSRAIECFFRLLHLAELDQHSLHREQFWKSYLEAGFIAQSWLILAPVAANLALQQLGLKEQQFGRLEKSRRIDEKHAVLLMRLDRLLIAEWSHVGKCRFWYQNSLHAPQLFKPSYSREELTDFADYIQQHYFSGKGLWQKDAAAWISSKAQIPSFV